MALKNFYSGDDSTALANNTIFIIARVESVVYGPYLADNKTTNPDYNDPTDIGTIRYIIINSAQYDNGLAGRNPVAKPAWPHLKQIPLEGEYVYLIPGPSIDLNNRAGAQEYYYLPPFGLWNSPHHNALPALNAVADYANQTQQAVYPLGHGFLEKADLKALRAFVGDVTLEGRWGNSIRFGSSLKANEVDNYWANSNADGDPITIIRNGQGYSSDKDGWIPTVENINLDKSSIYLTAGQQIVIDDITRNFPLNSFGIQLQTTITQVKEMTPAITSNEGLSPQFVDNQISNNGPNSV